MSRKQSMDIRTLIPSEDSVLSKFLPLWVARYEKSEGLSKEFSPSKHLAAALLALTNADQKRVAKVVDVSYSGIRKWILEDDGFRALMEVAKKSFAGSVAGYLKKYSPKYLEGNDWQVEPDPAFQDAHLYNPTVLEQIPIHFFNSFDSLNSLMLYDPWPVIRFVEQRFGEFHPGIAGVWKKHYGKSVLYRFHRENQKSLLSGKKTIEVDRGMLGMVLGVIEQYLVGDWQEI